MEQIQRRRFCWRVEDIDWHGGWGWSSVNLEDLFRVVIPKLHDYETMTWAEMDGPSGSHSVEREQLCAEAQARLTQIGKDHIESLFSVRVTGERRVWGVKDVAILRILWWDPEHSVCPSLKKHT